jgi:hypothetical protein
LPSIILALIEPEVMPTSEIDEKMIEYWKMLILAYLDRFSIPATPLRA